MSARIKIELQELRAAVDKLNGIAVDLAEVSHSGASLGLASFSPVSGLDQVGASHRNVSNLHEPKATKALSAHLRDTAVLIDANLNNALGVDGAFSQVLSKVGIGQNVADGGASVDVAMQMAQLINPVTNPFTFAPPIAAGVPSLVVLNKQFQVTDPIRAAEAAAAWQVSSNAISAAVAELNGVVAALSGSAETDWVREAIERVNRIQWAGGQYAAHSQAMAVHTENLATVAAAEKLNSAAAYATWMAAPLEAKPILELAYMAAFTPRLNAGLIPTVPGFNQLLPALDAMPGTPFQKEGIVVPSAPSFERQPLPKVVQEAFAANGYEALAYAETPAQAVERFGPASPQVVDAISAGATPTQAASTVATLPPAVSPGGAVPGVGGTSPAHAFGPGVSGPGGLGLAAGGPGGASGRFNPAAGGGGLSPRHSGAASPRHAGGGAGRGAGFGSSLGAASGAGVGAGLGALGRGAGGFGAGGLGAGALGTGGPGAGGLGAPGSGTAAGLGSGSPTVVSGGQTGSRGTTLGGPMGGAPQRGATGEGKKGGRIKAVTSAVEREGNVRALLGKAQAVLPDVIGSNVRTIR